MKNSLTIQDVIDSLNKTEDKSLPVEVSTGHLDRGGRFYGGLKRISKVEDHRGARLLLTGELEESLE
jgi:hypothetical protein